MQNAMQMNLTAFQSGLATPSMAPQRFAGTSTIWQGGGTPIQLPLPNPGGNLQHLGDMLSSMSDMLQSLSDMVEDTRSPVLGGGFGATNPGGSGIDFAGGSGFGDDQVISGEGRIWGDPHFVGADGGKYDVQGEAGKTYNLLSDRGFQMNGAFEQWGAEGSGKTVVGEVGIAAGDDRVRVSADGSVSINGKELDGEGIAGNIAFIEGGYVKKDGDQITVQSGEYTVEFQAKDSSKGDHLNMDVSTTNANSDGVKPHGLLGQSFDGDGEARNGDRGSGAQGGGAIEGLFGASERGDTLAVERYEVDGIYDTNFGGFNRFEGVGQRELFRMVGNAYNTLAMNIMQNSFASMQSMSYAL